MRTGLALILALVAGILVVGCSAGEVTESDSAKVRAEFSQDKYEAAMKAAGKGDELAKEKAAASARADSQ